jgi:hypothetical protein
MRAKVLTPLVKSLSEWVDVTGLKVPVYLLALSSSLTATAPALQLPLHDVQTPTNTAATLVPMRPKVQTKSLRICLLICTNGFCSVWITARYTNAAMDNETPADRKRRLTRERGKKWRAKPDVKEKEQERARKKHQHVL